MDNLSSSSSLDRNIRNQISMRHVKRSREPYYNERNCLTALARGENILETNWMSTQHVLWIRYYSGLRKSTASQRYYGYVLPARRAGHLIGTLTHAARPSCTCRPPTYCTCTTTITLTILTNLASCISHLVFENSPPLISLTSNDRHLGWLNLNGYSSSSI